jgi:hypothetical protein
MESSTALADVYAEGVASAASSASCQDFLEDIRVFPIVEPELKFRKVQR